MSIGYVFQLQSTLPGVFGVLTYSSKGSQMFVFVSIDATSEQDAIRELSAKRAGIFKIANQDERAWGRLLYKAQGEAIAL